MAGYVPIGFVNQLSQSGFWIFILNILSHIKKALLWAWLIEWFFYPTQNSIKRILTMSLRSFWIMDIHWIWSFPPSGEDCIPWSTKNTTAKNLRKTLHTSLSLTFLPLQKNSYNISKNIFFCKLAFSCYDQLNKFIKVHKDILPSLSRLNVVYKINCLNCDAPYVRQTKRTLNTRVVEHRNYIRRDIAQVSVITNHRLQSKSWVWLGWCEGVRRRNEL